MKFPGQKLRANEYEYFLFSDTGMFITTRITSDTIKHQVIFPAFVQFPKFFSHIVQSFLKFFNFATGIWRLGSQVIQPSQAIFDTIDVIFDFFEGNFLWGLSDLDLISFSLSRFSNG